MAAVGRRDISASYLRCSIRTPAASPMPSYLSIEALTVSYGGPPVLDRVSLDVEGGEMVALLGSSGCGKTTLLRAIAGFVIPDSGMLRIEGRDIGPLPPAARRPAVQARDY